MRGRRRHHLYPEDSSGQALRSLAWSVTGTFLSPVHLLDFLLDLDTSNLESFWQPEGQIDKLTDLFMEYAKMTGWPVANTPNVKKNGFQIFLAEILKS